MTTYIYSADKIPDFSVFDSAREFLSINKITIIKERKKGCIIYSKDYRGGRQFNGFNFHSCKLEHCRIFITRAFNCRFYNCLFKANYNYCTNKIRGFYNCEFYNCEFSYLSAIDGTNCQFYNCQFNKVKICNSQIFNIETEDSRKLLHNVLECGTIDAVDSVIHTRFKRGTLVNCEVLEDPDFENYRSIGCTGPPGNQSLFHRGDLSHFPFSMKYFGSQGHRMREFRHWYTIWSIRGFPPNEDRVFAETIHAIDHSLTNINFTTGDLNYPDDVLLLIIEYTVSY